MKLCHYLEGENKAPRTLKEAKALIGKRVQVLLERDIDKSGRGYFWPRKDTVKSAFGRNVEFRDLNWESISQIRELVVLEDSE